MRKRQVQRKNLYILIIPVIISILSLTIAYSALSSVLNIAGNAEIIASTWNIYLDNAIVSSGSITQDNPVINSNTTLSFSTELTTPGDFYEFTVDIVNEGSIDAMIDQIIKTPELTSEQAKYLKYEIKYQNGESITTKQRLAAKSHTKLKVRIEFRNDITVSELPEVSEQLNLKIQIVYLQDDNTSVSVENNGIEKYVLEAKIVNGNINDVGSEIQLGNENFYVINNQDNQVTMLAKYNLNVGGIYNGEYIPYGNNVTFIQNANMIGYNENRDATRYGVILYSDEEQQGLTLSDYSDSIAEVYVKKYEQYLINGSVPVTNARLITKQELVTLGCSETENTCSNAPEWTYSTSYWVSTVYDEKNVWTVRNTGRFIPNVTNTDYRFGIRPVIEIPTTVFN